jgi:hypothetical protein
MENKQRFAEFIIEKQGNLVEKYEKFNFLNGIAEDKKIELSTLYEDFLTLVINMGNDWGDCRIGTIGIPLIRKLYIEFNETNFMNVYEIAKEFYENFDSKNKPEEVDIDIYYLNSIIEYYKRKNLLI